MDKIYWIITLGNLSCTTKIIMILSIVIIVVSALFYAFAKCDNEEDIYKIFNKIIKYSIPIFIVSLFLFIFTPSKKDMFLIYGVGGTVDYIKQNDKAKQLPDKCINALDAWVNSMNDNNNGDN